MNGTIEVREDYMAWRRIRGGDWRQVSFVGAPCREDTFHNANSGDASNYGDHHDPEFPCNGHCGGGEIDGMADVEGGEGDGVPDCDFGSVHGVRGRVARFLSLNKLLVVVRITSLGVSALCHQQHLKCFVGSAASSSRLFVTRTAGSHATELRCGR